MQVSIRTFAVTALVALLVPVAAVAKDARVKGPATLVGAGYFGGELELAGSAGQRPVRILGRAGYVGVLDLAGDLRLRCTGTGRLQKRETRDGNVYSCVGRQGIELVLLGSHVRFRGFATHYKAILPAGASGAFHGRYIVSGERAPTPKPARETDEIPSLDELTAMLDGLDG